MNNQANSRILAVVDRSKLIHISTKNKPKKTFSKNFCKKVYHTRTSYLSYLIDLDQSTSFQNCLDYRVARNGGTKQKGIQLVLIVMEVY